MWRPDEAAKTFAIFGDTIAAPPFFLSHFLLDATVRCNGAFHLYQVKPCIAHADKRRSSPESKYIDPRNEARSTSDIRPGTRSTWNPFRSPPFHAKTKPPRLTKQILLAPYSYMISNALYCHILGFLIQQPRLAITWKRGLRYFTYCMNINNHLRPFPIEPSI